MSSAKKNKVNPGKTTSSDTFWMIRNSAGAFSDGTDIPFFTHTSPRRWEKHGMLLAHLTRVNAQYQRALRNKQFYHYARFAGKHPYEGCQVVEMVQVEKDAADVVGYGE